MLRSLLVGSRLLTTRREKSRSSQDLLDLEAAFIKSCPYELSLLHFPLPGVPKKTKEDDTQWAGAGQGSFLPPCGTGGTSPSSIWPATLNSNIVLPWSFEGKVKLGYGPPVSLDIWSQYGLACAHRQLATAAHDVSCL